MFQALCRFRTKQNETLDRRVRLMSEILASIRAVKLYAYESHLGRKVRSIRQEEIKILQQYGVMRATINSLFNFVPVVAIVCESIDRGGRLEILALSLSDIHHLLPDWP